MDVLIITDETNHYKSGDIIPESNISSEDVVPGDCFIMAKGESNPKGQEVWIKGISYSIGGSNKTYELTDEYAIKAVVCDGIVIPKLRRAKGSEQFAHTKMVKRGPRLPAERVGELVTWWPELKQLKPFEEQETPQVIQEAVETIEEIGDVTEDLDLNATNPESQDSEVESKTCC